MLDIGRAARAWRRALEQTSRTPSRRNRYIDFLRAAAIAVVVIGHWLMAAPSLERDALTLSDMLQVAPWSQWLTWVFQVMPLFFIVGGYANAASWVSARRSHQRYEDWLALRLQRLVGPVVPLVVVWAGVAFIARGLAVPPESIQVGSQAALIPTWFLAVYLMVVLAVPVTHAWWTGAGWASFATLAVAAATVDAIAFHRGIFWLRFVNYGLVWVGLHQLGYAWRAERLGGTASALAASALALSGMIALVVFASYPVSMVTVPGDAVSNTRPPTLALLFLGVFQLGLVRLFETPARRWLERPVPWCVTVLVNRSIMTLYLWHATALVAVVGLAIALGGLGLGVEPGSAKWWATRPLWLAICAAALVLCLAVFHRFERRAHSAVPPRLSRLRAWGAASALCAGLAVLASGGLGSAGPVVVRVAWVAWTLLAAAFAIGPPRFARFRGR